MALMSQIVPPKKHQYFVKEKKKNERESERENDPLTIKTHESLLRSWFIWLKNINIDATHST